MKYSSLSSLVRKHVLSVLTRFLLLALNIKNHLNVSDFARSDFRQWQWWMLSSILADKQLIKRIWKTFTCIELPCFWVKLNVQQEIMWTGTWLRVKNVSLPHYWHKSLLLSLIFEWCVTCVCVCVYLEFKKSYENDTQSSDNVNFLRVGWSSKQLTTLKPILSDIEYLQDQHLLLTVKSLDGYESYGAWASDGNVQDRSGCN